MKTAKIMKKAVEASTGLAVAAAFFNVALLVVELVKTVSADEAILANLKAESQEEASLEEALVEEKY